MIYKKKAKSIFFLMMAMNWLSFGFLLAGHNKQSLLNIDALLNIVSKQLEGNANVGNSWWYFLIICFFSGFLTSFLPCIYPMIPITIGIIQGQRSISLVHNFFLSLAYVIGIASTYAVLGYVCAVSTLLFGSWFASPWFMLFLLLFFIYLAGSMLGFYELYLPSFLKKSPSIETKGSLLRSFMLGIVSGTVASPCLAPPLAVLIAVVAKIGSPFFGFISFFVFSLGMTFLLLLVGTFSGALSLLPRSGGWLEEVKHILGFILLLVAVYFLEEHIGSFLTMLLYGMVSFFGASYYGLMLLALKKEKKMRIKKRLLMVVILVFILAGLGFLGAAIKLFV